MAVIHLVTAEKVHNSLITKMDKRFKQCIDSTSRVMFGLGLHLHYASQLR